MTEAREAQFRDLYGRLRIAEQLGWYKSRRDEYGNAHRQAIITRNVLLFLAAACGGGGAFLGADVRAWLGVVSAVLAGLAAALTGFESMMGFARLEKLYSDTIANLDEARIDWRFPDAQADGAAEVARVEEIFQTENGQWGQLIVETAPAVAPPADPAPAGGDTP